MAVTAAMVKELRGLTGVGMSACKDALVEADGNIEQAVEILRKKGFDAANKKAGRLASEGLVHAYITDNNSVGVVVEVNSETDFVARNQEFQSYVEKVAIQASKSNSKNMDEFLAEKWVDDESITVKDALTQKISVIGENLNIRRFEKFEKEGQGVLVSYVHGGGKVAVLIEMESDVQSDAITEAGKNIAMQIAAMSPKFLNESDISDDFIAKEKEILKEQVANDPKNASKPENIIEQMILGKLKKELKAFCLVEQEYVKDGSMTVKQYVDSVAKEVGGKVSIKRFVRFETGEGLEKKEENFADEVSKVIQG